MVGSKRSDEIDQARIGRKTEVGNQEKTGQVDDQGAALSVKSPEPVPQPGTLAQALEPKCDRSEPQTPVSPDGDRLGDQGHRQGEHKVQEGEGRDWDREEGPNPADLQDSRTTMQSCSDAHWTRKQVGIQRVCSLDCVQQVPVAAVLRPSSGGERDEPKPRPSPSRYRHCTRAGSGRSVHPRDRLRSSREVVDEAFGGSADGEERPPPETQDQERGDHSEGGGREDEDTPGRKATKRENEDGSRWCRT